jgi:hypothetical protein
MIGSLADRAIRRNGQVGATAASTGKSAWLLVSDTGRDTPSNCSSMI